MLELDVFWQLAAAGVVAVSLTTQLNDEEDVNAVMPVTVAVPPESATVPHTMRGEVCAVLLQVVVVPQVLTFCTSAVAANPPT
jgi:hypothetical protein